ncbi:MAG: tyrosine-type recombinase/integrase, partial [Actinobacteria bacterium]|nr:tyrosine-type recombinase/integrase [Actinomycetota bacterium]
RALGHKITEAGQLLPSFVAYLDAAGAETVTVELAMAWATLRPDVGPPSTVWGRRMTVARGFARHLAAVDPRTGIPPAGLLAARGSHRAVPYLYSDAEVAVLMGAARSLSSPLRAATHETLVGLLSVTGMRIGEALRLDRADLDWDDGALVVRDSKFGKSRRLPLQASTVEALSGYERLRDRVCPVPATPAFFASRVGNRLIYTNVLAIFHDLLARTGVGEDSRSGRRPRLHDFRHSFAVATLVGWYRQGVDVAARLPWLSTYLGHASPTSTYWYLSAAPELLQLAAARLDPATEARP